MAVVSTRDRTVDAALAAFATRGYEATSLDNLAASLGVRKQTILYHFASKEALLDAVIDEAGAELIAVLERAVSGSAEGWWRIDAVVRSVFRLAGRRPELLGLLREISRLGPPSATRFREMLGPFIERATAFLEGGMEAGEFRGQDARLLLLADLLDGDRGGDRGGGTPRPGDRAQRPVPGAPPGRVAGVPAVSLATRTGRPPAAGPTRMRGRGPDAPDAPDCRARWRRPLRTTTRAGTRLAGGTFRFRRGVTAVGGGSLGSGGCGLFLSTPAAAGVGRGRGGGATRRGPPGPLASGGRLALALGQDEGVDDRNDQRQQMGRGQCGRNFGKRDEEGGDDGGEAHDEAVVGSHDPQQGQGGDQSEHAQPGGGMGRCTLAVGHGEVENRNDDEFRGHEVAVERLRATHVGRVQVEIIGRDRRFGRRVCPLNPGRHPTERESSRSIAGRAGVAPGVRGVPGVPGVPDVASVPGVPVSTPVSPSSP